MEQLVYCFIVDVLAPQVGKKGGQSSGASAVSTLLLRGASLPQRCMYILGAHVKLMPPMRTSWVFAGQVFEGGSGPGSGCIMVAGSRGSSCRGGPGMYRVVGGRGAEKHDNNKC